MILRCQGSACFSGTPGLGLQEVHLLQPDSSQLLQRKSEVAEIKGMISLLGMGVEAPSDPRARSGRTDFSYISSLTCPVFAQMMIVGLIHVPGACYFT